MYVFKYSRRLLIWHDWESDFAKLIKVLNYPVFQVSPRILHKTYQGCVPLDKTPHSTTEHFVCERPTCQTLSEKE